MAQIIFEGGNKPASGSFLRKIVSLIESNLPDDCICYTFGSFDKDINHLLITGPDLGGFLLLSIMGWSKDEMPLTLNDIVNEQKKSLDEIKNHFQEVDEFLNEEGALKFSLGTGIAFSEINSGEIVKMVSDYDNPDNEFLCNSIICQDEIQSASNADFDISNHLFRMMEETEFQEELEDDEINQIVEHLPTIYAGLPEILGSNNADSAKESEEDTLDLRSWWESLDAEWKNCFHSAIGNDSDSGEISDKELKEIKELKQLKLDQTPISNLVPLKYLVNLEKLDVHLCKQISALEPLRNLTKLIELDIRSCAEVSNLEPLNCMVNLKRINLSYCEQISDISLFSRLNKLEKIFIEGVKVSDLEPLRSLENLEVLDCSCTQVSDIEPVRNLKKLVHLCFSDTQVSNIEPVGQLVKLKHLFFSNTDVSDFEALRNLGNLESVSLDYTQYSDLKPLRNLKRVIVKSGV